MSHSLHMLEDRVTESGMAFKKHLNMQLFAMNISKIKMIQSNMCENTLSNVRQLTKIRFLRH